MKALGIAVFFACVAVALCALATAQSNAPSTTTSAPTSTSTSTTSAPSSTSTTTAQSTSVSTSTSTTSTAPTTVQALNTTFSENGLPANVVWSVSFNGVVKGAQTANSILFSTVPGNYPFLVQNVTSSNAVYVPAPANGVLAAGSTGSVQFSLMPATTTTTTTTTASSTSSTSTANATTTVPVTRFALGYSGEAYSIVVHLNSNHTRLEARESVLRNLTIQLNQTGLTVNLSVANRSQVPGTLPQPGARVYQYIQINGSAGLGKGIDIDNYVKGVVYNFSVPMSWLAQQGASGGDIRLFKYYPSSGGWGQLPTSLTGSNGTSYFYSAVSSSLSGYVVGFTSGSSTSTSGTVSNTLGSNFMSYFFGWAGREVGVNGAGLSVTWTNDANMSNLQHIKGTYSNNMTAIGHNTIGIGTATLASGGTYAQALTSFGANVNNVLTPDLVNIVVTNSIGATASLTYTEGVANSLVVLLFSVTGDASATISTPLAGCATLMTVTQGTGIAGAKAALQTCNALAVGGPYTASITKSTGTLGSYSIASYVFPPQNVVLKDIPAIGNIITNGIRQVNGNTITVLGTNQINAVPFGTNTFISWSADTANQANVIFGSLTANPTSMTVLGPAIVTATYTSGAVTCTPVLANTLITFQDTNPGAFSPTANAENVAITGTTTSHIWVSGGAWANVPNGAPTFTVGNTLWSATSGQNIGTQLTSAAIDTGIPVRLGAGNGNVIFFGLNIPTGTAGGAYNQIITISSSC